MRGWLATLISVGASVAPARVHAEPPVAPAIAAPAPSATSIEVPHGLTRFRSFGSAEGLHNLVVLGIVQDASGALWVGADDGVYRYDSQRFWHYGAKDGLPSTVLNQLGIAPDGNVCVGGPSGLACWDGARFVPAGGLGVPSVAVHAVVSALGKLWVGTADGLSVRDDRGGFARAPGWPGHGPVRVLWGSARELLAVAGSKVLASAGDGVWHERTDVGAIGDRIDGLLRDRDGAIWLRGVQHVWRLAPAASVVEDMTPGMPSGSERAGARSMTSGPAGEALFGTELGLVARDGEGWRLIDRRGGLPNLAARTLFTDRDGAIWIGSVGLFQQRGRGLIERHDATTGVPGDVVWGIARGPEGALWIATHRCLARMLDGSWQCLPGSEHRIVRDFAFAPQGGVFFGGGPPELVYIDPAGHRTLLGLTLPQVAGHAIQALEIGPDGDLWIATKAGLYRLPGAVPGAIERVTIPGLPLDTRVSTLTVAAGRLWASTANGLAVNDHGRWRTYGTADGFAAPAMRFLTPLDEHAYCVGYAEAVGVTCFELAGLDIARLRHIGVAEGLVSGAVYFLGADRQHRLWIGTGDGIDVETPHGLDHFGEADGLAGNDSAGNAFFLDRDGSLWVGSTAGLSHVQAQRYTAPPPPPRAVFRGGELGGQPLEPARTGAWSTPHDRNALRAAFGPDRLIDADRVSYQVRLWPIEQAWSASGGHEARYPALQPGAYRLEVRARIDARSWGDITALAFTVTPAWWQTDGFRAAVAGLILLALAGGFVIVHRRVLRRRTRQLNEQSAAGVRALLESVPDLISVHRGDQVVYCNLAARRFYGLPAAAANVIDVIARIHPDDRGRFTALITASPGARDAEPVVAELRVRNDDGGWRICELSGVAMELAGATVRVASGRDVTERRQLHARLLLADRMASLGTLAAGIAHEINNPLSYVLGSLETMAERLAPAAEQAELAGAVRDATDGAERVRKIIRALRAFSRSEEEHRVALALPEVLDAAIRLTANEIRHRAQLICELGDTPHVIADDGRLTQVFINLILNAAHAIPEGRSDEHRITVRTSRAATGHAVVEIADTGRGMPADVLARVFDPFYTTNDIGAGTGLGLSICHGIVSALGGTIAIHSTPGHGTTVHVTLPAAPDHAAPVASPPLDSSLGPLPAPSLGPLPAPPPDPSPGLPLALDGPSPAGPPGSAAGAPGPAPSSPRLRVLVVEDEPRVCEMIERALRREHEVIAVSCGRAALDQVAGGAWFDVIISDVMMPNMTGVQLLETLLQVAPAQARRLVFLSGGVFTADTRARLDELGTIQLEKPISGHELRSAVRRVAAASAARNAA